MTTYTLRHNRLTWTNIVRATPEDVAKLRDDYPHFHPLDLEDLLSRIERPKIDEYVDYLFVVMQFPIWDPVQRISRPSEVDMFIGSGFLITAHDGTLKPLDRLYKQCDSDERFRAQIMGQGAGRLFYNVIDRLVDYIFPILYKVDGNIRRLEDEIFDESERRKVLQELAVVRRDVLALGRIVRPQIEVLRSLEDIERPYIQGNLEVYFGDILDHLNKASDLINDHREVVTGLADTANTLANLHTNEIIRVLTIISVIMMPLTVVSGIFGMNVTLPFQSHPFAFGIVIGVMLAIVTFMLFIFQSRRWL